MRRLEKALQKFCPEKKIIIHVARFHLLLLLNKIEGLPNALPQCYLQRASAMLLKMYNALARGNLQRASAMLLTM